MLTPGGNPKVLKMEDTAIYGGGVRRSYSVEYEGEMNFVDKSIIE
jgi:hypothetical protein